MAQPRTEKTFRCITDADMRREWKSAPAAGYLLFGEEDYLKAAALTSARETLGGDETLSAFNVCDLDGMTVTPEQVRAALATLPMMADRKLVFLRGLNFSEKKPTEIDAFLASFSALAEYDYNTLLVVAAADTLDEGYLPKRPSALLQKLGEVLTPVRYERCTPARLAGWCSRHFSHNGVSAAPETVNALLSTCGRDMYTLAGEIDKVSYYVLARGKTEASEADVKDAACVSEEFDGFALSGALTDRDTARALEILADMEFRRVEPLFALSEVIRTACEMLSVALLLKEGHPPAQVAALTRLHEFKVTLYMRSPALRDTKRLAAFLDACRRTDSAMKLSAAGRGYAPLYTLLCSQSL